VKDSSGNLRSIHLNFYWKEAMEPPVKSMSFVLFEPARNAWYNNYSKNYNLKFDVPTTSTSSQVSNTAE
jgi:type IV secretory pathway protease TraF